MRLYAPLLAAAVALLTCLAGASPAKAVAFSLLGTVGYEAADLGGNDNGGGLGVGVTGDFALTRLAGGPTLIGGAGLKYAKLSFSKDGTDSDLTLTTLGFEIGFGFPLASRLALEAMLGYDLLLSGDMAPSGGSSKTVTNFGQIDHEYRAIFAVYPATEVGFGLGWFHSSFDITDTAKDVLMQGYALRFILQHHF